MNVNNVSNTAFKGTMHFVTMPVKYSADNSNVGNAGNVGWAREEFQNEIGDMKRIMHVPKDESEFYDLRIDPNQITFLSPTDMNYHIPNTNYEASFLFNGGKPLSKPDYAQILAAYTAAKAADKDVTICI